MDKSLLEVFCSQILTQCEFLLRAYADLDPAIQKRDVNRVFFNIQAFLSAAANIAKALWGQGSATDPKVIARRATREPLRVKLKVLNTSPLYNFAMRNHYDHFDERIDEWWRDSKNHLFADLTLGVFPAGPGVDERPDVLRSFDPKTRELRFWGDQFNIAAIAEEVRRIHQIAQEVVLPPPPKRPGII
jgi:hypothetical protein